MPSPSWPRLLPPHANTEVITEMPSVRVATRAGRYLLATIGGGGADSNSSPEFPMRPEEHEK